MDIFNLFNNLDFNPNQISNNIGSSNFRYYHWLLFRAVWSCSGRDRFRA